MVPVVPGGEGFGTITFWGGERGETITFWIQWRGMWNHHLLVAVRGVGPLPFGGSEC